LRGRTDRLRRTDTLRGRTDRGEEQITVESEDGKHMKVKTTKKKKKKDDKRKQVTYPVLN
jgi:16S rRNA U1498 N3-methylase RsmE